MSKSRQPTYRHDFLTMLIGLPFLVAGLVMGWMYFYGYAKWWLARDWVEVPCWVKSVELSKPTAEKSRRKPSHQTTAIYRYSYGGRDYEGGKVALSSGFDNLGSFQVEAFKEISSYVSQGDEGLLETPFLRNRALFRCYVNPSDPSEAVLYRGLRWEKQAFSAIFALTCPAVGAIAFVGGLVGLRGTRRTRKMISRNPKEPWICDSNWKGRSIRESSLITDRVLNGYTIWSGLVIFLLYISKNAPSDFPDNRTSWSLWLFSFLWCVLAWFALQRWKKKAALGPSRFEPAEMPAVPGSKLTGNVVFKKWKVSRGCLELRFLCERIKEVRDGRKSGVQTDEVWSQNVEVDGASIIADASGFRLPVAFDIPLNAPDSGNSDQDGISYQWHLVVKVPGLSKHLKFCVPVIQTGEAASPGPPLAEAKLSVMTREELSALLAEQQITLAFDSRQMLASLHRVWRGKFTRMLVDFFVCILFAFIAVFLYGSDYPLTVRICWLAFAGILLVNFLWCLLFSSRIDFGCTSLVVKNQLGPHVWNRLFRKEEIAEFICIKSFQTHTTKFFNIHIESISGKKRTLIRRIKGELEATSLVAELRKWKTGSPP